MFKQDVEKKRLFDGLCKHFPYIPIFLILRTVELASSPGVAFDALYDYKDKILPAIWDFKLERWKKEIIEII